MMMWKMFCSDLCIILNTTKLPFFKTAKFTLSVIKDQLCSSYTAYMNTTAHLHISLTALVLVITRCRLAIFDLLVWLSQSASRADID